MGLFDRLSLVVRANLNDMVERAENPEMILEKAITNMQQDLAQLRQAVARANATKQRTEQQYNKNQSEANQWQQRAQLALQKGDKNLATEALLRKKAHTETAATLKAQLEQMITQVDNLKSGLIALESKISEAKAKKDILKSRAVAARANEHLKSTIGRLDTNSAMSAFERMEEKVMEIDARSHAIGDLLDNDVEKDIGIVSFRGSSEQLEEMRRRLKFETVPRQQEEVLAGIEKAIHNTRNAISIATSKQSQLQHQHSQTKAEVNNFHKQALQAALKGDQALAVQALVGEANHEKLAEVIQPQIEQQKAVIELLKKNLEALVEVKISFEKFTEVKQHEGNESSTSTLSESEEGDLWEGDDELEAMKAQLTSGSVLQQSSTPLEETTPFSSALSIDEELESLREQINNL